MMTTEPSQICRQTPSALVGTAFSQWSLQEQS